MKFSVLIINYNYGRFIETALDSVLSQARFPDEIVAIDDGSTDDSLNRLAAYGDRVRVIGRPNGGHVQALQDGLKHVRGDGVLFLDADDYLYPNCLLEVERAWTSLSICKVQYRLDTVDKDGVDQKMTFPNLSLELSPEAVRRKAFQSGIYPWTVSSGNVYGRAFLDAVLPIDVMRFPRSPDGYLNKLAPLYGDVVSLPLALGAYRVHGKNSWAQGQGAIDARTVTQTVALDLALDHEFRRRAVALGLPIAARTDLLTPQHLEYRLLSFKLDRHHYPVDGETLPQLLKKAVSSVGLDPMLSPLARWAWRTWFIVFAALPVRLAEPLYRRFRSQTRRSSAAKLLIQLTRLRLR